MQIDASSILGTGSTTGTTSTTSTSSNNSLGQDAFLKLLIAQMKYQDPLDPSSSQDYIAQLAQFSQLDQLESMKTSLSMGEAASMIGKTVKGTTTAGATLEGTVKSIQNDSNGVVLVLADGEISLDKVTQVSA